MAEVFIGDDSVITLVESPRGASHPRALKDEFPSLLLSQLNLTVDHAEIAEFKLPSSFQHSVFTSTTDKNPSNNGRGVIEQQELKFSCKPQSQPSKKFTLEEALILQVSTAKVGPVSYRTVSEEIIRTICESLDPTSKDASPLLQDVDTTDKVSQIIRCFVSANFVVKTSHQQQAINFLGPRFRSQERGLSPDKTTLDFYADILPIDLAERAKVKSCRKQKSFTSCVAVTLEKERCKIKSNMNESTFDALVKELSSTPKPRDFSKVIKILLGMVELVFCNRSHREKARCAIHSLCVHFHDNKTSSSREVELKCLDQWLRKLGQDEELEGESDEAKEETDEVKTEMDEMKEDNILLKSPFPLSSNGDDTSTPVSMAQSKAVAASTIITNGLFLFDDRFDSEKSGFRDREFNYAPNLTHKTLQLFNWGIGKKDLSSEQLVDELIQQPVTKSDRGKRGSIYVYRHVTDFGFVKIGCSVDVGKRIEGWETQCNYMIDECKDQLKDMDREAPHPRRLEGLIHAELSNKRYQVLRCEGCGKKHQEWFNICPVKAQEVVKKWTLWMQKNPYDENGCLKVGEVERPAVSICELGTTSFTPKNRSSSRKSGCGTNDRRQSKAASQRKTPERM